MNHKRCSGYLHVAGVVGWCEVSCILRHRGVQLILAYSWARPAILVTGKGRGGCFYFFCFFTFIPAPLSSLYLSFISSTISYISFLPFSGRRHKMTHKGWRVVKPQHNQSKTYSLQYSQIWAHIYVYTCLLFIQVRYGTCILSNARVYCF